MNILDYAASVPTPADWTAAFQQAIADLRTRGGGTLIVPAGDYPTGAIRLYDNMTLHIESGAVLRFHQDASAFPLIDLEFEGIAGLAHQPCIYAEHAKNVTITGLWHAGGQGSYWWTRQPGRAEGTSATLPRVLQPLRACDAGERDAHQLPGVDGASALLPECGHSRAEYQKSGGFPQHRRHRPRRLSGCAHPRLHD